VPKKRSRRSEGRTTWISFIFQSAIAIARQIREHNDQRCETRFQELVEVPFRSASGVVALFDGRTESAAILVGEFLDSS
jgi:hypothetical protein